MNPHAKKLGLWKVQGYIERITFHNTDEGDFVLRVEMGSPGDLLTVRGRRREPIYPHLMSVFTGQFREDKQFGPYFFAETIHLSLPPTIERIEGFLGSGVLFGVGPKVAKKIVEVFGVEAISIIDKKPERLAEVPGMKAQPIEHAERIHKGHGTCFPRLNMTAPETC